MTEIADDVVAIIEKKVPGGGRKVSVTDRLEDLGLESVDFLEMVFDLEEKFDVQVPYNANTAAEDFATVQDVVDAITRLVESDSA